MAETPYADAWRELISATNYSACCLRLMRVEVMMSM